MYEPAEDSYLLREAITEYCKYGKIDSALDMGTGSGIQAEALLKFCSSVVAVDISPEVIDALKEKIKTGKILFIQSDLFEKVPEQKFGLIVFNPPYLPEEEFLKDDSETIGGEKGVEVTIEFLKQAKEYLAENGTILFIASSLADLNLLEEEMKKLGYKFRQIKKQHVSFEDIFVYEAGL